MAYMDEFHLISGDPICEEAKKDIYRKTILRNDTEWIDIFDNNNLIGFLIIGRGLNCHPDADFFIQEAYIVPAYRNQGHMTSAITRYIQNHGGKICLLILNENHIAKIFWKNTFDKLGYKQIELRDVGATDEFCSQYGFEKIE